MYSRFYLHAIRSWGLGINFRDLFVNVCSWEIRIRSIAIKHDSNDEQLALRIPPRLCGEPPRR
jgi:hypothetical protein